ncbi:MAG: ABC transporter substrate-binding protein [Chloroflexi bacterium]|nr:ABC transporter substrate-binding protein [Chloroflexota bacterium]
MAEAVRAPGLSRRRFLSRLAIGLVAPAALGVLSACGGSAPAEKPAGAAPTTAPAPAAASPAPGSAPAAPPAAASPAASPAAQAAPAVSGPPATLTIGATTNIQTAMFPIGVEKGIYLKQNVDLKVKPLNAGTEAIKAVQAGEAQFATLSFATMSAARAQDIKMKALYLGTSDPLIAKADDVIAIVATANSGITKVADLVGKRIGTTSGVAPDFYLKAVLAKANIDLNRVELVNVQPPNMLASMQSGLDAASASEPYPELLLAKIPGSRVVSRGGGYVAQRTTTAALESWIAANRALGERFSAATAEAVQFMRKNPEESAQIASRYLSGMDVPVISKAIGHLALDPRMSPAVREGWDLEIQDLIQRGTLKQPISFEEGVDFNMLETIVQKYPRFFDDLKPLP